MSNCRSFRIDFVGPPASGKTIAMQMVEKLLIEKGYTVVKSRDTERGFEHALGITQPAKDTRRV